MAAMFDNHFIPVILALYYPQEKITKNSRMLYGWKLE